ncbi:hypothetical protein SUGI_0245160 [Cryptomeria japonica]|nr:hypothetical protein SUGI_0245160 [Cryptomeria japonica]
MRSKKSSTRVSETEEAGDGDGDEPDDEEEGFFTAFGLALTFFGLCGSLMMSLFSLCPMLVVLGELFLWVCGFVVAFNLYGALGGSSWSFSFLGGISDLDQALVLLWQCGFGV